MKKNIYISLSFILVAFSGGVYYGFHAGVENYSHLEKVLSSNIDVLRAKDLKGGSEKELKYIYWEYEMSISEAIDSYNWYRSSGDHLFSKVFLSSHLDHLEKSIENIASYRSLNPVESETESLLCKLPESETDKEYCLKRLEERQETVRKYEKKS
ncbi:hypothetical protein [Teredinibacter purpureus]|uniref:hypothetical protein n=1 Tax=Teredinibacter purpureus TaxID=2731756 RepID=UPI0005F7D1E5|nr:hypothetical protein [Teredinibacter purpureus]